MRDDGEHDAPGSVRVDGRVAIVTGASRGIGAAAAVALAEVGADVVIAARSKDALAEVTEQIEAHGRRAAAVAVDLDDLGAMQSLIVTDALGMVLNDELEELMVQGTPMRRLGQPDDIALGVIYLASSASDYMTGRMLEIDGGINFPTSAWACPTSSSSCLRSTSTAVAHRERARVRLATGVIPSGPAVRRDCPRDAGYRTHGDVGGAVSGGVGEVVGQVVSMMA